MTTKTVSVAVIGVSGSEHVKGPIGVGKSLLCNRFIRGSFDEFFTEHCSVLSQTDFGGSPVINSDHWLFWGERRLPNEDVVVRLIEQTEFLDDETYEPIAGPSKEDYCRRACRVQVASRDKLMYLQKEQLGLEADFSQQVLPDGKFVVDGFVVVCDASRQVGRHLDKHVSMLSTILSNVIKTKKPVVVVFSKCDDADEDVKKTLLTLFSRKDSRNLHLPPVEVSSIDDVNVEEVFHFISTIILRTKLKRKIMSFRDAAHTVQQNKNTVRIAYLRLLDALIPTKNWPTQRLTWHRLLGDLDRNPDFVNFVRVFGSRGAYDLYERHVADAREHWMSAKLRMLAPQMPCVFSHLLEPEDVEQLDWHDAKNKICSHALFDEFFQPIGSLGKQLEPLTPEDGQTSADMRLPAEILLRNEAKVAYDNYKKEAEDVRRKEKLEEDFEVLLSETRQVSPGKPLAEVLIFLQGCGQFEALSPSQTCSVYDRYQRSLIKQAESDLVECLLEYSDILVDLLRQNLDHDTLMNAARECLQQDPRYRWLSRLFDVRDLLVSDTLSFLRNPSPSHCPASSRCIDIHIPETLDRFFHRRNDTSQIRIVDVVVHGQSQLVAKFIAQLDCFLRNEPFPCGSGNALIRLFDEKSLSEVDDVFTDVFLLDSPDSFKLSQPHADRVASVPPVFVVVSNPSNFEHLPTIQQQGAKLAAEKGGSFFGVGSTRRSSSHHTQSDFFSLLSREQTVGICEAVCSSQLTRRRHDYRIQVSLSCGDPFSLDAFIGDFFGDFENFDQFRPVVHPNFINSGIVPVDIRHNNASLRVDFAFRSSHCCLCSHRDINAHSHIIVFSTRRPSSLAQARAVLSRLLFESFDPRSLLFVAVDDVATETSSILLNEGIDLCTSVGSRFIRIPSSQSFFHHICQILDDLPHMLLPANEHFDDKRRFSQQSDDYATVSDHIRPTTLNIPVPTANGTRRSSTGKPGLKIFRSDRVSKSGPILLSPHRKIIEAPLATPEMVEIAPEYSLVNDALTCEEHIYETIDVDRRHAYNGVVTSQEPTSRLHRTTNLQPHLFVEGRGHVSRSKQRCDGYLPRAITVAVFGGRSKSRDRKITSISAPITSSARQSQSAESLAELVNEKKKRRDFSGNRFVRKVATSFRFKKDKLEEKREEGRKSEEPRKSEETRGQIGGLCEKKASRSLPQSPHLDRKQAKKYSSLNTTEKVSSALSWLPTRSPKRTHKSATVDISSSVSSTSSSTVNGVVGCDETLATLCEKSTSGIPIFVEKCVDFIEKNGGLDAEGLYRVPGNQSHLVDVERIFRLTGNFDVSTVDVPVHVAATALKNFFSCLPSPLIPHSIHGPLVSSEKNSDKVMGIVAEMPDCNRRVLGYLIGHFRKVSMSTKTAMDMKNLSKVWFPTLFRPNFDSYEALSAGTLVYQQATELIFEHFK